MKGKLARKSLCARSETLGMQMDAYVSVSPGDMELTPLATRWVLNISIRDNGHQTSFHLVSNLFESFLEGAFAQEWMCTISSYQQQPSGFEIVFTPALIETTDVKRRYVKRVDVCYNFVYYDAEVEAIFLDMCVIADYGFSVLLHYLRKLAPAVFTRRYHHVIELGNTLRPLQLALGLDDQRPLVLASEQVLHPPQQRLLQNHRNGFSLEEENPIWIYVGGVFAQRSYEFREYVPLNSDDTDEIGGMEVFHEPIFPESIS